MDNDSTGNTAPLSPDEAAQRENDRIKWLAEAQAQAQQLVASNNEVAAWWASLPAGRGLVVGGEPTGPLSLAERADRGLLADNPDWLPAQEELPLDDVLWLECPTGTGRRSALADYIRTAVNVGKLVTHPDKPGVIQREAYRQWRAQCPASLLSESSVIAAWIGELSSVNVREDVVKGGAARPVTLRDDQQDKLNCQEIAKRLWAENPDWTQTRIKQHPKLKFYVLQYKGKNTLPGWLREVDPRPKEQRRGRPRNPI